MKTKVKALFILAAIAIIVLICSIPGILERKRLKEEFRVTINNLNASIDGVVRNIEGAVKGLETEASLIGIKQYSGYTVDGINSITDTCWCTSDEGKEIESALDLFQKRLGVFVEEILERKPLVLTNDEKAALTIVCDAYSQLGEGIQELPGCFRIRRSEKLHSIYIEAVNSFMMQTGVDRVRNLR